MSSDTEVRPSVSPARARFPWWARVGVELIAVVIVIAASLIILARWMGTDWEINLLYSGDSLVLPLVRESVLAGEPFEWVFSSQLFLFPEGLLYWIVSSFTDNPRAALAGLAVLNLVLLYVLLRWCSRLLFRHSRHRLVEVCVALGATATYVVYVLLEPTSDINGTAIASLFLLVSYYPGVVLSGLTAIALTLWVTDSFTDPPVRARRTVVFTVLFVLLGALTGASNPLFWMQVLAPFAVTLFIAVLVRRIPRRWFWTLGIVIAASVIAGYLLRQLMERYGSRGVGSYFNPSMMGESLALLKHVTGDLLTTPHGFLKLLIASVMMLITAVPIARALIGRRRTDPRWHVTSAELILALFSWASVGSLVIGMVITGTMTTRYLEPLFVFPLLSASYEAVRFLRVTLASVTNTRVRRSLVVYGMIVASGLGLLIIIGGLLSIQRASVLAFSEDRSGAACTADLPADAEAGVGTFWLTRNWDLYGTHDDAILQVNSDLTVFPWMINLASYDDQDFTFVVVDPWGFVTDESVAPLGPPKSVQECGGFTIYDYAGTPGEELLNERIDSSLLVEKQLRGFE